MGLFSGPGVTPSLKGAPFNEVQLNSGECYTLFPAGWYMIKPGPYTSFQQKDPITGIWRAIGAGSASAPLEYVYSDGISYRLANQTGCVVGALVTNGGTLYTSPPTITATGGAIFSAVLGGALSTAVTVTNGGTNYTYPPIVAFSPPPPGGVAATGYCTLSGSAVSTVTVTDQGAGYSSPPTITFINDPREGVNNVTQGYGAAAVGVLTGAGTVTAVLVLDHGQGGQTAVPTLTFAGGGGSGAAATAIMCFTITAYTVSATTAGSGYATPVIISAYDIFPATSPAYTNPTTQSRLVKTRQAMIIGAVSGVALTTTGLVIKDGGIYTSVPTSTNLYAYGFIQGAAGVQAVLGATVGGTTDISYLTPV